MSLLALLLAQAAATAAPERFSILYDPCAVAKHAEEVVVCAKSDAAVRRLPLRDDAPPTSGYVKPDSRDYRDNAGHDAGECGAEMRGCLVGFGPPIGPTLAAVGHAVATAAKARRDAQARARDGDRRVAIDLGDDASAGHVEP